MTRRSHRTMNWYRVLHPTTRVMLCQFVAPTDNAARRYARVAWPGAWLFRVLTFDA